MYNVLEFIFNSIQKVFVLYNSYRFEILGVTVGLMDLMIGFIILGMVVVIFWKGARS